MSDSDLPQEFLERLSQVKNKRPKLVIDHILEHGYITNEDLLDYGYTHGPRAARDVREEGIPLKTFKVKSSSGKSIAAYRFDIEAAVKPGREGGRKSFPKKFKAALYAEAEGRCAVCNGHFLSRELQVDHRIPYEIGGDAPFSITDTSGYMLLCSSCNRAKSWSCEHCDNWDIKDAGVCATCHWASPTEYQHIALRDIRRADIVWEDEEVPFFDRLKLLADAAKVSVPSYIKAALKELLKRSTRFLGL